MQRIRPIALAALLAAAPLTQATGTLNIYNWSDYIADSTVPDFQKRFGVKVRYDIYDSMEILRAKLMTGKSGYDLVVPTHNTLDLGIKAGLFQPIDRNKLPNFKNVDPAIMRLLAQFDPGNHYAIPYFWGVITLGINADKVKKALGGPLPDNPWDMVFKPELTAKLKSCGVSVLDSPAEYFPLALHYAGKNPNSANPADYQALMPALNKVRPYYTRFTSSGYLNDLAGGSLCVAMGYSGDLNIAKRRAAEGKNGVKVEVLVPRQGMSVWVDSLAIPKDAANVDNALKFINYTLDANVAANNANAVTFAPGSLAARPLIKAEYVSNKSIFPGPAELDGSFLMQTVPPKVTQGYTRLWQRFKSGL